MEGFECDEEDLEMDAQFDGERVEALQGRDDVLTGKDVWEEADRRVLDVLQFVEGFLDGVQYKSVAEVTSRCDKGMD